MKQIAKTIILATILVLHIFSVFAQQDETKNYYHRGGVFGQNPITGVLSTGNTGTGSNIDVNYHRCNWTADPDDASKTLKGNVTTYFKTIAANISSISFDFNNTSFNNDSLQVLYHGTICSFSFPSSGNFDVLNITLPTTIVAVGTLDSVTIKYQGVPPAENGDALGYQRDNDGTNNYIYTLSESYEDKDWWPCKADMQDKIDSIDINVTVPSAFWVAANGLMTDSTIKGNNRTFKFKHRYPIASYLVAIGIAKFKRFYLGNLATSSNSVPFVINLFPGKTSPVETNILNILNNHKLVFATLNNFFGDYPYAKEKHGFYEFGFGGGMEHQTFSGIGGSSFQSNSVLAHELAHQWWGDKVTFATWNHLWLAEGFATYSEILMAEFVPSIGVSYLNKLTSNKSTARSNNNSSIYLNDVSNSNTVWTSDNTSAVYNRGCMVVSMLRTLMGDTKFFTSCKNYLNDTALAYKSATTADLQRNMETQFGENMTNFFTEWIMKKGSPRYTVLWGNESNKVNLKLTQTVSSSGTSGTASTFFPMPVIIKIADTINGFDTTVVIYHKAANLMMFSGNGVGATVNSNTISYNLSFTPNKITFDPQNKTMATATVSYSAVLPIAKIDISARKIQNKNQLTVTIVSTDKIEKVELRKSVDGINFNSVGVMKNILSTSDIKQYQLIDESIAAKIYYSAKVYTTNDEKFSSILAVENKTEKTSITLSPNPASSFVNVYFNNANNTSTIIKLSSANGKALQTKKTNNNSVVFETSSLAKGTYFIAVYRDGKLVGAEKLAVE